ncbi:MAG: Efflux transporter, family, subunit [Phycisphaerales bacterium]|nr:Efflux transporter, family, subunit [Phycisphaerales bacterium]MDB5358079.1 Efflux transporter, family, subunit [Phycisphaerales bacterium]
MLSVLIVAGWIAGCGDGSPATGPPPPPAVTVTHPVRHVVIEWDEYTGTTASPETVNVVARVSGYIESAPFIEGSIVNKGDLLFVIDPRPFQAALDAAKANADKARAQARLAADQLARYTQLLKQGSVSPQDYENVKSASEQANAALAAADAAVESAQLDLEWTRVTAPIKGRIGRKLVTPGNFVNGGAGQATPLTTIQSVDPMYCYFYVNERAVLKYQRLARQRLRPSARETRVPVLMQLPDETDFPHVGVIDFIDNRIDPGTETITVRGLFANPDNRLLPGMFVRVRVPGSGPQPALLIPDVAIGVDQNINYVLVVGPDNTVDRRTVTVGAMFGKLRAIDSGLSEADRVIVEGIQRARPGAKVAPTEKPIPPDELPPPATTMPEPPPLPTTQAAPETAPATQPTPQTAPAAPTTRPLSQAAPAPAAMPPAHDTGHAGSPALILRRARGNPP